MDPSSGIAALGVYGVTVSILLFILVKLWAAYQEERHGRIEDQKVALPALERSAAVLAEALKREADRAAEERIRTRPRGGGSG